MYFTWINDTPVGRLLLAGDEDHLKYILFENGSSRRDHTYPEPDWKENPARLKEPVRQLQAYFRGDLKRFDLSLAADGTEFQQRVWRALSEVPFGNTASYGEIARMIGRPAASRAVGMANGRNPISIVVPCHRIIGGSGKLVGYGGGLHRKTALLRLEGVAV